MTHTMWTKTRCADLLLPSECVDLQICALLVNLLLVLQFLLTCIHLMSILSDLGEMHAFGQYLWSCCWLKTPPSRHTGQ